MLPVSAVLPANAEANDTTPPITGMSFERDNGAWAVVAAVLIPGVMRSKGNEMKHFYHFCDDAS